jgi:formate hydrogenlyase subunit 4
MSAMIERLAHVALLLLLPPLLPGVIGKTKAWFAGRRGAPLLQPYHDILKLLGKGAVYSRTTTWVFRAGPVVSLACLLTAGLIVPLVSDRAPLGFVGDVVVAVYLLALARFVTMAAALDTGSSFEGMGASREAAFSALAEPTLLLALAIACLPGRSTSFETAWTSLPWAVAGLGRAPFIAASVALFAIYLAENSRIPIDDPNTHLELTMIHEVMVLDHGGPDLAFIVYGSAVKLFVLGSILVHIALPHAARDPWGGTAWLVGGQLALAVTVGVVESIIARLRLPRVPQFLIGAFAIAAVGLAAITFRVMR